MRYTLTVEMDNVAFDNDPGSELARILREAANRVEGFGFQHKDHASPLRDVNGNKVGQHGYTKEDK